jgi:ubiquinone/menaquinone biosynthesis C-methylase UbiE
MIDPSHALATEYSERADAYARYWAPVIHPMAYPLLSAIPLANAERILDVGVGTGALWPVIQRAAPRAYLCGVDRALGMLRAGEEVVRGRVAVMDAEHLGFRAAVFDQALLVFVLFHIADRVGALRGVRAILRARGLVGVVVWGADPGLPGAPIWVQELDREDAAPDPRDPRVMQHDSMNTIDKLAGLLEQAGLNPTDVWSRRFVHQWTVERLIALQTHCGVPFRRLRSLPQEARQALTDRVRARLEMLTLGELAYDVEVIYGVANRPD